jgi:hypothetical protein
MVGHDINPTVKGVPGRPPMFVFVGKSRESAALVRGCSLIFSPTVAKTVAIGAPSVDGRFDLCPFEVEPLYTAI